MKGISFF